MSFAKMPLSRCHFVKYHLVTCHQIKCLLVKYDLVKCHLIRCHQMKCQEIIQQNNTIPFSQLPIISVSVTRLGEIQQFWLIFEGPNCFEKVSPNLKHQATFCLIKLFYIFIKISIFKIWFVIKGNLRFQKTFYVHDKALWFNFVLDILAQ